MAPTADRKEREKERRRSDIIEAAEKLFFSRGYESVTMDDIAKETELARGTLYLYFKNKDDICVAIAARGLKILNGMFSDGYNSGKAGIEKLRLYLLALYEFHKRYPGYDAMIRHLQAQGFSKADFPEMEEMERIHAESTRMVIESFHEGMSDGTVRSDAEPMKAAMILTASMQSVLSMSAAIGTGSEAGRSEQDEFVNYAVAMLLRSVEK
jgi:AcrR family transcriptional regulator